jgi:hypothetical protein
LLVAKENAKFRSIVDATGGIIFLGCLHDESHPDLQDICLKTAAVEFKALKKHEHVEALRKAEHWDAIKEVMESFRTLRPSFPVRGFFERLPTVVPGSRFSFKKSQFVSIQVHIFENRIFRLITRSFVQNRYRLYTGILNGSSGLTLITPNCQLTQIVETRNSLTYS